VSENVIPFEIGERMRRDAARLLRDVAQRIEELPREKLPDVLLRLPLDQLMNALTGRRSQ